VTVWAVPPGQYDERVPPPRLVATDIDGTLLRSDGSLGPPTARALRLVAAAGVPVVPATARPLRWLDRYPWAAGLVRYAVVGNGAVVYDTGAEAVISRRLLSPATLAELCERICALLPSARFAVEIDDGWLMRHEPGYPLRSDLGQPGAEPASRNDLVSQPAVKLLVKAVGGDPAVLISGVAAAVGGRAEATVSAPQGDLVELAAPGVTKATGLATVAARLGVAPTEVVAFGDMPNDLPMLSWAGRAVAVANAHPDVLAAADEVTGSNDDDGVATWLVASLRQPVIPAPRSGAAAPAARRP
jgi:hypothetical protein